jgi:hypothetical protein
MLDLFHGLRGRPLESPWLNLRSKPVLDELKRQIIDLSGRRQIVMLTATQPDAGLGRQPSPVDAAV